MNIYGFRHIPAGTTLEEWEIEQRIKSLQERRERATKKARISLLTRRINACKAELPAFKLAN